MRVVEALACLMFVVSIFVPFLTVGWYTPSGDWQVGDTGTFWSFKVTGGVELSRPPFFALTREVHSFVDYWYALRIGVGGAWEGLMILMFATQVLTVLWAIFVICLTNRFGYYSSLLSAIYSIVTVFSMWFFCLINTLYVFVNMIRLEIGFWLTLASSILFCAIFLIWTRFTSTGA